MKFSPILHKVKSIHSDSLYRNSIYLIGSQFVLAIFGFFFWIINARLFTPEQVGIATTLISVTGLITSLAQLGFNTATIRYYSTEKNKNDFINTVFSVVSIGAIVLTTIFIVGVDFFSKPLNFIQDNIFFAFLFLIFMVISTLNAITDSVFIALRSSKYVLIINTFIAITKLASPLLFVAIGALGIFYGYVFSLIIGTILSFSFLFRSFSLKFYLNIKREIFFRIWKYSLVNYAAGILGMLSSLLIPVLITNTLGPATTAYYFMPSMILNLLAAVVRSTSSSMFAEGSLEKERLRILSIKTIKSTYILLVPLIIILMFTGKYILLMFGKSYSDLGIIYLRYAMIALLLSIPNSVAGNILNLQKRVYTLLTSRLICISVSLLLIYNLLAQGLSGIGLANIFAEMTMITVNFFLIFILPKINRLINSA